ncbi:hypothetical protein [Alkalibacillus haloalkaliphilus]|uniref:hypothetical protein n=1 Tax=Alkalibacillus haloalkaliphilus TaxID=94136 RepID=UPI00293599DD|nr:hypothetical protein [Alkalibacillus haloalkaliphilus]MDV2582771.1 hypothetical protein [Alkalibacillus haloalkaliphilus]
MVTDFNLMTLVLLLVILFISVVVSYFFAWWWAPLISVALFIMAGMLFGRLDIISVLISGFPHIFLLALSSSLIRIWVDGCSKKTNRMLLVTSIVLIALVGVIAHQLRFTTIDEVVLNELSEQSGGFEIIARDDVPYERAHVEDEQLVDSILDDLAGMELRKEYYGYLDTQYSLITSGSEYIMIDFDFEQGLVYIHRDLYSIRSESDYIEAFENKDIEWED